MMMATTHEHYRIKILDWGGDAWRWHRVGKHPAMFPDRTSARQEIRNLRSTGLVADALTKAVRIPEGGADVDKFLQSKLKCPALPRQPVRKLINHLQAAEEILKENRAMRLMGQGHELERLAKSVGALARKCVEANRRRQAHPFETRSM